MSNAKVAAESATRKMSNVETLRELTPDELDIVAGGYSLQISFSNNKIAVGIGAIDLSVFGTQHPFNVGIGTVSFS
jgi:hypothetical protein